MKILCFQAQEHTPPIGPRCPPGLPGMGLTALRAKHSFLLPLTHLPSFCSKPSPQQRCCSPPSTLPASYRPPKSLCVCLCAEGWTRRRALAQSLRVSRLCLLVTGSPVEMVLNKPINYFSQHIFYSNSGKTYCYSVFSWLGPILAPGWPLQAHCCAAQHQLCRFISAQQILASCRL